MDEAGAPIAAVTGVYLRRVQRRTVPLPLSRKLFRACWEETPAPRPVNRRQLAGADRRTRFGRSRIRRQVPVKRRVITADLNDESEVQNAFADFAGDPAMPRPVCCSWPPGAAAGTWRPAAHARELIWSLAAAGATITGGWHGKSPGCGW